MKKRFENAQVGDEVYCELLGDGVIDNTNLSHFNLVPLRVLFLSSGLVGYYTLDGKYDINFLKATLFYRQGENRNLTERPKRKIKRVIEGWIQLKEPNLNLKTPCIIAYTSHLYATKDEVVLYGDEGTTNFGEPVFIRHAYEVEE